MLVASAVDSLVSVVVSVLTGSLGAVEPVELAVDGAVVTAWVVVGGAGAVSLPAVSAIASPAPAAATMATASPGSSRLRRPSAAGTRTTVAAVEPPPLVSETAPASSATSALPSCGRSAGLLASDADATLSRSGGASDRKSDTSGGGRSRCMVASARASCDSNGSRAVSIRNRITPNA